MMLMNSAYRVSKDHSIGNMGCMYSGQAKADSGRRLVFVGKILSDCMAVLGGVVVRLWCW